MGREIRRVPPNWEHPRYTKENARYQNHIGMHISLDDKDYETASAEWESEYADFMRGEHKANKYGCKHFWEWSSPPDEEVCRPKFTADPTWFQVYETVSEGTPVTPPFATTDELVDWLVTKGEMHGTQYERRFTREQAEGFVKDGSAPSMVISGGIIKMGIEACSQAQGELNE